ncbi:MAG: 6-phosphofructokinase [Planctomycetota bacterium]|nr:6-phosphofructokinase [Planctomycetota bacterium]MCX8040186.1 6-phosphofructokinase [Planctomycetota bacterium]MDW8372519.1 6-phosphofructokinase [Planctomycetota bacterium]
MAFTPGTAVVGQSGGPTAVINQTLVGVVKACLLRPELFTRVLGAVHGINGILKNEFVDFALEDPANLEAVAATPSSALKSVRRKASKEDCEQIFARFRELNVRAFFYIGGNDTAETAHIIDEMARAAGYDLACVHCPKTIDNDLRVTDHCPGYGSAAKFVAQAFIGDNLDNRSLAGIKINVVMGRNAGWLTAASALARIYPDDGPHLIYCPEVDFALDAFCRDVEAVYRRLGRCVVAVSEGIHGPGGAEIIALSEVDSHGNKQLSGSGALGDYLAEAVRRHLARVMPDKKHRVRADTFGYLQRCFPGVVSETDAREARLAGVAAVEAVVRGERSCSIAFQRFDDPYRVACFTTPLASVAKETKPLPRSWINEAGNDIVPERVLPYLRPLVGELPRIARLAGIR